MISQRGKWRKQLEREEATLTTDCGKCVKSWTLLLYTSSLARHQNWRVFRKFPPVCELVPSMPTCIKNGVKASFLSSWIFPPIWLPKGNAPCCNCLKLLNLAIFADHCLQEKVNRSQDLVVYVVSPLYSSFLILSPEDLFSWVERGCANYDAKMRFRHLISYKIYLNWRKASLVLKSAPLTVPHCFVVFTTQCTVVRCTTTRVNNRRQASCHWCLTTSIEITFVLLAVFHPKLGV